MGASGGVMVSKLDEQTYTSEFESHWVPLSYGLVPHLSKMLSKLTLYFCDTIRVIINYISYLIYTGKDGKLLETLDFITEVI